MSSVGYSECSYYLKDLRECDLGASKRYVTNSPQFVESDIGDVHTT
jgi:hypothetical protein